MSFFYYDLNLGVGWKKFQPHLNTYAVDTRTYKIRHLSTALSLSKPDNNRNRQICVKLLLMCLHRRVYLGVGKTFLAGSRSVGILIIIGRVATFGGHFTFFLFSFRFFIGYIFKQLPNNVGQTQYIYLVRYNIFFPYQLEVNLVQC